MGGGLITDERVPSDAQVTRAEVTAQAGTQELEPALRISDGADCAQDESVDHVCQAEAEVPDGVGVVANAGREDALQRDDSEPTPPSFNLLKRLSSFGELLTGFQPSFQPFGNNVTDDTICQGERVVPCVRATFGASGSVEAEIAWADPPCAMPELVNAAQLRSKIALVSRGGGGSFFGKARLVQAAGAAAVVFVNDRADAPDENLCCAASGYAAALFPQLWRVVMRRDTRRWDASAIAIPVFGVSLNGGRQLSEGTPLCGSALAVASQLRQANPTLVHLGDSVVAAVQVGRRSSSSVRRSITCRSVRTNPTMRRATTGPATIWSVGALTPWSKRTPVFSTKLQRSSLRRRRVRLRRRSMSTLKAPLSLRPQTPLSDITQAR
jgi:hypothetical protein